MTHRIISILFLVYMAVSSMLLFLAALCIWGATAWFDRRLVALHMFTSFWACLYIWSMPAWSLEIRGRHLLRKGATYVLVSNHQSQLDILVAFRLFFPFKWVSKEEVFRLPFIGWNMRLNRYIPIRRGDRQSVRTMMTSCERALRRGSSVYFFPEGTRSRTGHLKAFKTGAFSLARKMKVPIVPIAISGTRQALPKYSLNFHGRHRLRIKVLEEIGWGELEGMSDEQVAEWIQARIAAHVDPPSAAC